MPKPLAKRLQNLGTETAFAVAAAANAHAQAGGRVYAFHLGDLNLQPPPAFVEGVAAAIAAGKNGYCAGAGIAPLREQIAKVAGAERGASWTADNVAVQPGGKPVIGKFLAATMNEGDSVLCPVPGFPIYESQIRFLGGTPAAYYYRPQAGGGFALDIESLRAAARDNTTAIIYNNYHNPTGAAASEEELDAVAALAQERDLWVLCDDAYYAVRFGNTPARHLLRRAGMAERVVCLFTFSKQFSMTGWRLGAAIAPPQVVAEISKMNTNGESCTTHFIQQAAADALAAGVATAEGLLPALQERGQTLCERLQNIADIPAFMPQSAFFVYCDLAAVIRRKKMESAEELMRATLQNTGVSYCVGSHFGDAKSTHARFAFGGIGVDKINEGMEALKEYFEKE